jgi:hypothetical protein
MANLTLRLRYVRGQIWISGIYQGVLFQTLSVSFKHSDDVRTLLLDDTDVLQVRTDTGGGGVLPHPRGPGPDHPRQPAAPQPPSAHCTQQPLLLTQSADCLLPGTRT